MCPIVRLSAAIDPFRARRAEAWTAGAFATGRSVAVADAVTAGVGLPGWVDLSMDSEPNSCPSCVLGPQAIRDSPRDRRQMETVVRSPQSRIGQPLRARARGRARPVTARLRNRQALQSARLVRMHRDGSWAHREPKAEAVSTR